MLRRIRPYVWRGVATTQGGSIFWPNCKKHCSCHSFSIRKIANPALGSAHTHTTSSFLFRLHLCRCPRIPFLLAVCASKPVSSGLLLGKTIRWNARVDCGGVVCFLWFEGFSQKDSNGSNTMAARCVAFACRCYVMLRYAHRGLIETNKQANEKHTHTHLQKV